MFYGFLKKFAHWVFVFIFMSVSNSYRKHTKKKHIDLNALIYKNIWNTCLSCYSKWQMSKLYPGNMITMKMIMMMMLRMMIMMTTTMRTHYDDIQSLHQKSKHNHQTLYKFCHLCVFFHTFFSKFYFAKSKSCKNTP